MYPYPVPPKENILHNYSVISKAGIGTEYNWPVIQILLGSGVLHVDISMQF